MELKSVPDGQYTTIIETHFEASNGQLQCPKCCPCTVEQPTFWRGCGVERAHFLAHAELTSRRIPPMTGRSSVSSSSMCVVSRVTRVTHNAPLSRPSCSKLKAKHVQNSNHRNDTTKPFSVKCEGTGRNAVFVRRNNYWLCKNISLTFKIF